MTVFKSLKGVNFQISYKYLLQNYVKKIIWIMLSIKPVEDSLVYLPSNERPFWFFCIYVYITTVVWGFCMLPENRSLRAQNCVLLAWLLEAA